LSPRSGRQPKASTRCRPLRGLKQYLFALDPGAGAPGFMLPPASRARGL